MRIINGCSPEEISVQHDANNSGTVTDVSGDYYNPISPSDGSCHLFDPRGADLPPPDIEFLRPYEQKGVFEYVFQVLKYDLGDAEKSELVFRIAYLNEVFCNALGGKGFNSTTPYNNYQYYGDYRDDTTTTGGGIGIYVSSDKTEGCHIRSGDTVPPYVYHKVLIIR